MHLKANELHAVWDSVVYTYHASMKRPYTSETFASLGSISQDLFEQFDFTQSNLAASYATMRDESFEIAKHVYDGITEGSD